MGLGPSCGAVGVDPDGCDRPDDLGINLSESSGDNAVRINCSGEVSIGGVGNCRRNQAKDVEKRLARNRNILHQARLHGFFSGGNLIDLDGNYDASDGKGFDLLFSGWLFSRMFVLYTIN